MSLEEFTEKQPSAILSELKPGMKNLDLKFIVLHKNDPIELKKKGDVLTSTLVADHSGQARCNFFGELGLKVQVGDILYVMGAYSSVYNGNMVIYSS